MKPILGNFIPVKVPRPEAGRVSERLLWTFSMRFWRQAEDFGLGGLAGSWFVSLCDRLTALCQIGLDEFFRDTETRQAFRFHAIDWQATNVPVQRADFDWLPKPYLENEDDFPFYQFHVSKGLGRIVGFFDERQTFNVLLFDPNHNIQPSKYTDYKIRPTSIGSCQFSAVVDVAHSVAAKCAVPECEIKNTIRSVIYEETLVQTGGIVICRLSDEQHDRFRNLRQDGKTGDISDILEMGLLIFEETA
jgi:hypothetical protein